MKKIIVMMFLLFISTLLYGCGSNNDIPANAVEKPIEEKTDETKEKKAEVEAAGAVSKNQEDANQEVHRLKQEKDMFLTAYQISQDIFQGIEKGEANLFSHYFDDSSQVLNNQIVAKTYDGETYVLLSDQLLAEASIKMSNFFLDDEKLIIIYDIYPLDDEAMYHLVVGFVQNKDGSMKIQSIGLDA